MMHILYGLVLNEIKKKMVGSYFGWFWIFIRPVLTILTMWMVFSYGFKTPPVDGAAFIVWISAGLIVWFFFSESLTEMTVSIVEYSFLLRQVGFESRFIPLVKLLSVTLNYLVLMTILLIIYYFNGGELGWHLLQLIYYSFCLLVLVYSFGLLLSSIRVFIKDISDVLGATLQVGFWISPIIWNIGLISSEYLWILKLNPLVYVIEGMRGVLIYEDYFWLHVGYLFYFWTFVSFVFVLGSFSFKRLKPHFNDVL